MSWTWILTGLSIAGAVLNIRRERSGFLLWAGCNLIWMFLDLQAGMASQGVLFGVYAALALWGFARWGRDPLSCPWGKRDRGTQGQF